MMKIKIQWHEAWNGNNGYEEVEVLYYRVEENTLVMTLESVEDSNNFAGVTIWKASKTRSIPLRWIREFTMELSP